LYLDFLSEKYNEKLISKNLYNYLESKYNPSKAYSNPLSDKNFNLEEEMMIDIDDLTQANINNSFSPLRNSDSEQSLFIEYINILNNERLAREIKKERAENYYQKTGIKGKLIK
jgi:hypothetical protein